MDVTARTAPAVRTLLAAAIHAVVYLAAARLGQALVEPSGGTATLWPATGIAAGALYALPARSWPPALGGLVVGAVGANLLAGTAPALALAFGLPGAAAPVAVALLARRLAGSPRTLQPSFATLAQLSVAAAAGCGLAALAGAFAAARAYGSDPLDAWLSWWSADVVGVASLGPLAASAVALWPRAQARPAAAQLAALRGALRAALADPANRRTLGVLAALSGATVASGLLVFAAEPTTLSFRNALPASLPLLFTLALAWRFGPLAFAACAAAGSVLAALLTASGQGPFATPAAPPEAGVRGLQVFLAAGLVAAAASSIAAARERLLRQKLGERGARLRALLAHSQEACIALDEEGRICDWNPAATRLFGHPRERALGRTLGDLFGTLALPGAGEDGASAQAELRTELPGTHGARLPVAIRVAPGSGRVACQLLVSDLRPLRALERELARVRTIVEQLRTRLIEALREREALARERSELAAAHQQLRGEHDQLHREHDQLRGAHQRLRGEYEELESEHQQLRAERDRLAGQRSALADERDRLLTQLAAARHAHERARGELEQARAEVAELSARRQELAERLAAALDDRDRVARRADELAARVSELEGSLANSDAERARLRARLEELERERQVAAQRIDRLERLGEERAGQLADAARRLRTLAAEREAVGAQLARAEGECERLRAELERSRAQLAADRERLERAVAAAERSLLDHRARLERAESEAERRAEEIERLRARLAALQRELGEERSRRLASESRLAEADRALQKTQSQLAEATGRAETLAREAAAHAERAAHAEAELARAERIRRRWHASFERTRRPAALVEPGSGRIAEVNKAFAELHGRRAEELVGRPFASLATPRHAALLPALDREVRKTGYVRWEVEHRRADGSTVPVAGEGIAVRDSSGEELYRVVWLDDLSALRLRESGERAARARFDAAFEHAPLGIALVAADGQILRANPAFAAALGYPADQLAGSSLAAVTAPDDAERLREALARAASGSAERWTQRLVDAAGRELEAEVVAAPLADGRAQRLIVWVQDASERRRFEGQLQHLTDHDGLTGLFNAKRFREELERELAAAARYGSGAAVLAIDIDGFRYLNGALGHEAADELLARIADALRRRLRATDVAARTGSDEFAVLLPRCDLAQAQTVARGLLEALESLGAAELAGRPLRLTASIGAAAFAGAPPLADELLVAAESALWEAKERGGNTVCATAAAGDGSAVARRLAWGERLRRAIDNGRLELLVQPLEPLAPQLAPRAELVVRMLGDEGELVPPAAFMPAAERFGLAAEIDRWAVRKALELLVATRRAASASQPTPTFELELSPQSLADGEFASFVERALRDAGIDGRGLALLWPESAAIAAADRARLVARRLRDLGIETGLSGFGAGFGSFRALEHLPFDYLKIDPDLVAGLARSRTRHLVVRAIADLARSLGRRSAATGADDEAIVMLRAWGVDYAQRLGVTPQRFRAQAPTPNGERTTGADALDSALGATGNDLGARASELL